MPLKKLKDFDPNYRETIGSNDVQGFKVYTVERAKDWLCHRYFSGWVRLFPLSGYDLGLWIFNKQIVLPVERSWSVTMQNESTSLVLVGSKAESLVRRQYTA